LRLFGDLFIGTPKAGDENGKTTKKTSDTNNNANDDKDYEERFNECMIAMRLAEHGLGPKIYACFSGGRIEEFVQVFIQYYLILLFYLNIKILKINYKRRVANFLRTICKMMFY